jgi:hypothetical protein
MDLNEYLTQRDSIFNPWVIPLSEVGNKPGRDVGRSMGFGNTPLGLKFISTLQ